MKFSIVASSLLLAGSAVAAPGTAMRRERHAKRAAERHSNPIKKVAAPAGYETNKTNVEYSSNWAGAIMIGTKFTEVTGTFTVPKPSSAGSGAAWVGIDGDTCDTAILQTGVDWTKDGDSYSYDAWYEWYPDYSYDFSDISVTSGDVIKVTVTATSDTAGKAVLENVSTGTTVTHSFSNEGSEGSLCMENAEWIVEDFEEGDELVSFADFGTVTFTDVSALENGVTVYPTDATLIDIESDSDQVLTDCTTSSSKVSCTYE